MNRKYTWVMRHGFVVRRKTRDTGWTSLSATPPRSYRNELNRRLRRVDKALLQKGRWDDFRNRLTRDAGWYWLNARKGAGQEPAPFPVNGREMYESAICGIASRLHRSGSNAP